MKSRDFQLATSGTGLFEQKPAALEPIKLEEFSPQKVHQQQKVMVATAVD